MQRTPFWPTCTVLILQGALERGKCRLSAHLSVGLSELDEFSEILFQLDLRGRVNVRGIQKFIQDSG
jgi:hypothetical protein